MDLCNPAVVRRLLEKYSLSPKKCFGQNFLVNSKIPMRIAEESVSFTVDGKPRGVIEIGPGVGALTQYLCESYDKVVAVEIDRGLIPLLSESLAEYDNVSVVEADFMSLDLPEFVEAHFSDIVKEGGTVGVCANLPYYITTPVIMKLLESYPMSEEIPFSSIVVMVQLEVARRLASGPDGADYGAISASVALRANVHKLLDVPAGNFHPIPKVASAVIGIVPHGGIKEVYPQAPTDDISCNFFAETVSELISLAFGQRRKTFVNAVSGKYSKEKAAAALEACSLRADIRGERLSVLDFCTLADFLSK